MNARILRRAVGCCLLAAAPLVAIAQPPELPPLPAGGLPPLPAGLPPLPGGGMGKPGMNMIPGFSDPLSPMALVDKPVIQNELDLQEVQLTEIAAMKKRQEKELEKLLAEKKTEFEKQLMEKLLPKQETRLRQIVVQLKKNRALQDGFVVEELQLSDEQVKKIEDIYAANEKETQALFQEVFTRQVDPSALRERGKTARAKLEADLMGVLDDEQKKKFETLGGEKFEVNAMDLIAPPMGLDSAVFPPGLPPLPGAKNGAPAPVPFGPEPAPKKTP